MAKLAAIRLRGTAKVEIGIRNTLDKLRLRRMYTLVITDDNNNMRSMMKVAGTYVAWGEISPETEEKLKDKLKKNVAHLHPPKGGFKKDMKHLYPKGEPGYRGAEINEFILRLSA